MSKEDLTYIERYWAQELSEKELEDFDIRYKTDPEFAEQVDLFRNAKEAVEALGQQRLKEAFRQKYETAAPAIKKFRSQWFLAVAAAIALLLVFVFFNRKKTTPQSPQELFAQYYSFETLSLERSEPSSDSLFILANDAYNNQNFEEAIPILDRLLTDAEFGRREYALLHLGISFLQTKQETKAISTLARISGSSSFYQKAQWNIALAHLKLNELEKAKSVLEKLAEDSRIYGEKAREILDRL